MSVPDLEKFLLILYPLAKISHFQAAVLQLGGQLLNAGLRLSQHRLLNLQPDPQQKNQLMGMNSTLMNASDLATHVLTF